MNKQRLAGIDIQDINRLADHTTVNVIEEVVSAVRRMSHRRSRVDIFDVIDEVTTITGVDASDVQNAFDVAYQDHRIVIDKDGFVCLVNAKKRQSRMLKGVPKYAMDGGLWKKAVKSIGKDKGQFGDYWATVRRVYATMGGRIAGDKPPHREQLCSLVARFQMPVWVQDQGIWAKAINDNDPTDPLFWGKVVLSYKRGGGRTLRVKEKTADFSPRPFDTHPTIWKVTDGYLSRDLQAIQSMVADGVEIDDLKQEMVEVGASRELADDIIQEALDSPPLI